MARRVLLVQPSLQPPGGGNGVAAWMLQALASEHQVTVLSWRPVEVEPINRFFGTSLRSGTFRTEVVPAGWRAAADLLPVPAALLRSGLLMRYARRLVDAFDVIVGAHNEVDYGRRGIQYVHYPAYLRPRPEVDLRWYHRFESLLHLYYAAADRLADFSVERMKANLTLANSNWTAGRLRAFLGVEARTLYPPVVAGLAPPPWSKRHRGFLAMGRISPEKEFERIIGVVALVRRHAPDVTLTIVGTWDAGSRAYYDRLRALATRLDPGGAWLAFRHDLSREEVRRLVARHRYGIHGMREEHFGMAPAEMVRGGMIVWVPNGGGQVEIVGDLPLLRYDTEEEAADKILRVISDPVEERRLLAHLAAEAERYSVERFVHDIRTIVSSF